MPPINRTGFNARWERLRERHQEMLTEDRRPRRDESIEADENSTNTVDVQEPIPASVPRHLFRSRPTGWWRNRQGEWIRISDMPDGYLMNVIRFVERQSRGRDNTEILDELQGEISLRQQQHRLQQQAYEQAYERQMEIQRRALQDPRPTLRVPMEAELRPGDIQWRVVRGFFTEENIPQPQPEPEAPPLPDRPRRIRD